MHKEMTKLHISSMAVSITGIILDAIARNGLEKTLEDIRKNMPTHLQPSNEGVYQGYLYSLEYLKLNKEE
jgi:hypothetical protein